MKTKQQGSSERPHVLVAPTHAKPFVASVTTCDLGAARGSIGQV